MKNNDSTNHQWSLHKADVLKHLKDTDSNTFSGVLTDAPYGIAFMNHEWDAGLPDETVWSEMLRICKPGAHLLCFGGTKTFHRLMCHIEDAGWQIRDTLSWIYGEGMPKGLNVGKAVAETLDRRGKRGNRKDGLWNGYNTALKPAWEPIIMAMKPLDGTFAENALDWGCGALNIPGTRIRHDSADRSASHGDGSKKREKMSPRPPASGRNDQGRWPANLMVDPPSASLLDQQSGQTKSTRNQRRSLGSNVGNGRTMQRFNSRRNSLEGYTDEGGASRFFYCPKASKAERAGNDHPTVKPLKLCEYLAKLILPAGDYSRLLVPFSGSGSEMLGALMAGWHHVDGIEKNPTFVATARKRLREWTPTSEAS